MAFWWWPNLPSATQDSVFAKLLMSLGIFFFFFTLSFTSCLVVGPPFSSVFLALLWDVLVSFSE